MSRGRRRGWWPYRRGAGCLSLEKLVVGSEVDCPRFPRPPTSTLHLPAPIRGNFAVLLSVALSALVRPDTAIDK